MYEIGFVVDNKSSSKNSKNSILKYHKRDSHIGIAGGLHFIINPQLETLYRNTSIQHHNRIVIETLRVK